MTKLTALDLFCGAGGLALGLRDAGFDIVGGVDNDPAAVATYERNLGPHVLEISLDSHSVGRLTREFSLGPGMLTLVAGGPPCQGFSLQRRGVRSDPRNELVREYFSVVEALQPTFFLMENVGGLMSHHGKPYLRHLLDGARSSGYDAVARIIDAVYYGVPQFRRRAFIVGWRTDRVPRPFRFPHPTRTPLRTVRDAIGDLPLPPQDGSVHPSIPNHFAETRLSKLNLERIKHVPPGGGRLDLPEHLQLRCHRENPNHRHLDVYGRASWDQPSGTLTARFDSFTRGRFAHPDEHRSLTLREGARIQTFPDDFVFTGSREEVARQIGNAVPPLLALAIGRAMIATLTGDEYDELDATEKSTVLSQRSLAF